jgi:hypothetical protein
VHFGKDQPHPTMSNPSLPCRDVNGETPSRPISFTGNSERRQDHQTFQDNEIVDSPENDPTAARTRNRFAWCLGVLPLNSGRSRRFARIPPAGQNVSSATGPRGGEKRNRVGTVNQRPTGAGTGWANSSRQGEPDQSVFAETDTPNRREAS